MGKQIQMALLSVALLFCLTATSGLAQTNNTQASAKMSGRQMMAKMKNMSTDEKAAMFDKMTHGEKMNAMKMAGHNMSKMSNKEQTDMMSKLSTQQKAEMFDKVPMDTRMATMRMAMKSRAGERAQK